MGEMWGEAFSLAQHRIGCRTFIQLVKNAPQSACAIIDAVLENVDEFITHDYAHHLVEKVLEHGLAHQVLLVLTALLRNLPRCVTSTSGKYVLLNALRRTELQMVHRATLAWHLLVLDLRPTK